mmetsp:Transcript_61847/g.172731  ORF Transcript_61847/g.172731 Transcript_61847/m.172731 type:complete len:370 (+) Transcript_61847:555-1664(+)
MPFAKYPDGKIMVSAMKKSHMFWPIKKSTVAAKQIVAKPQSAPVSDTMPRLRTIIMKTEAGAPRRKDAPIIKPMSEESQPNSSWRISDVEASSAATTRARSMPYTRASVQTARRKRNMGPVVTTSVVTSVTFVSSSPGTQYLSASSFSPTKSSRLAGMRIEMARASAAHIRLMANSGQAERSRMPLAPMRCLITVASKGPPPMPMETKVTLWTLSIIHSFAGVTFWAKSLSMGPTADTSRPIASRETMIMSMRELLPRCQVPSGFAPNAKVSVSSGAKHAPVTLSRRMICWFHGSISCREASMEKTASAVGAPMRRPEKTAPWPTSRANSYESGITTESVPVNKRPKAYRNAWRHLTLVRRWNGPRVVA